MTVTIQLAVLGAGPAYTDREGASGACYLVSHGTTTLLLDLGQGSFPRIFHWVRPEALDAVVVSHLHPDHFIDLVSLRHYLRYEFEPSRRVRVLGPADLGGRLDALHASPGFAAEACSSRPSARVRTASGSCSCRAVSSPTRTRATPCAWSRLPARVPDWSTAATAGAQTDIAPLVRPGDTLLAEVSFGAGPVPRGVAHLDGPAVGRLATSTGAGRVLLTHLLMGHDAEAAVASCRAEYSGPVEMVWPGSRLDV